MEFIEGRVTGEKGTGKRQGEFKMLRTRIKKGCVTCTGNSPGRWGLKFLIMIS